MKYLIVQDWNNTHGNHAGMVHMCRLLVDKYPNEYEMFVKPEEADFDKGERQMMEGRNWLSRLFVKAHMHFFVKNAYYKYIIPMEYFALCKPMFRKLKDGDEVFLLEYLISSNSQLQLARYIHDNFPNVRVYALSHLTVSLFKEYKITEEDIQRWALPVNKMLTLGSSLSFYFEEANIKKDKISTGFHYVDSDYYKKEKEIKLEDPITVIAMGNLQRDYNLLAQVVKQSNRDVHWIICHGNTSVGHSFDGLPNVELKGYLSEDELKSQMDRAEVSISIMKDTVGSNVITTSLAMGLAMVVSDVGSIRDYCSEDNAIFCENTVQSFAGAINALAADPQRVLDMRNSSVEASKRFSISNVNKWFSQLK